jgi:hypothetical protein
MDQGESTCTAPPGAGVALKRRDEASARRVHVDADLAAAAAVHLRDGGAHAAHVVVVARRSDKERFTRRTVYTQNGLHAERFTRRTVYTQNGLHAERFTRRTVYTQNGLHAERFTRRTVYTQNGLHVYTQNGPTPCSDCRGCRRRRWCCRRRRRRRAAGPG